MLSQPEPRGARASALFLARPDASVDAIQAACAVHGLSLEVMSSSDALLERLAPRNGVPGDAPDLVLVETGALAEPEAIGPLAELLAAREGGGPPLVCLASDADLRQRLAALRAGAADYIPTGTGALRIARRLSDLLGIDPGPRARVLVVDDQPVAALFAARVLESAGMVTARCEDPLRVLTAAEGFLPDLVLMDLHMPGANGIELTGLLREQERFADLPIVFLSCELDPSRQLDAFRVGADDFLRKPVEPQVLVERVRRGLAGARRRAMARAPLARLDPDTGLAARERLLERLDQQMVSATPWRGGLLYLELPTEGISLALAANLLSQQVTGDDLAARVGEHGLAVLLRRDEPGRLSGDAAGIARAVAMGLGEAALGAGLCPLDQGGSEAVTLVSRARKAACANLKSGGAGLATYGYGRAGRGADRREVILAAVDAGSFELLFQPVVTVRGEPRARYEATLRVRTDDGELLGPDVFAPVVTRARVSACLDTWVLEASLDALARSRAAGSPAQLLVHQTLAGLGEGDWLERLRDGISRRDLIDLRPVIQLQAADADRRLELASARARALRTLGIELCLNGLGEGRGRGVRLLDAVQARFVRLAGRVTASLAPQRLKELVAWLHGRGVLVIAGGLESPDAIARVMGAGVDCIQGPFIQSPAEGMGFDFSCAEPEA